MSNKQQELYTHLGYLFYSVAAVDKRITPAEMQTFKSLVRKTWVPIEDSADEFGSDNAFYIEIAFDYLQENGTSSDAAYKKFEEYFIDNKAQFGNKIKQLTIATADEIANSFSGTNKSELSLLTQLRLLLQ
jgi:hypothetical protein